MKEAKITALSHDGRGIAHINGKIIFIDGALPDEIVTYELTKKHQRFNEAHVLNIIQASPYRVEPRCPHVAICAGCNLQHLEANQQIALKQQTLLEQLEHFGHLQPENILPPLRGPIWGYRHKARLSVKYVEKKQAQLVGFHEKNGRYVADLSRCDVLNPKVGLLIEPLKKLVRSLTLYREIAQIEVAIDEKNTALIFRHLADMPESDQQQLINFAKQYHCQIYLQPNKPNKIHRLWPIVSNQEEEFLFYHWTGKDADKKIIFSFYPTDFTQVNPEINQQMVNLAIELLDLTPNDHVLDLFSGLGNFTLPIALYCKNIIGIEGNQETVDRAEYNAKQNKLLNTQFFTANLAEPNLNMPWAKQAYTKILLDPPRTGALEIIQHFPRWNPERIVYISCNPATLARDAGELVNKQGYRLVKAGVMDMFPHTKHVESIALFIKGK